MPIVFRYEGQHVQAQADAEAILAWLNSHRLNGVDELLSIHLTCFRPRMRRTKGTASP